MRSEYSLPGKKEISASLIVLRDTCSVNGPIIVPKVVTNIIPRHRDLVTACTNTASDKRPTEILQPVPAKFGHILTYVLQAGRSPNLSRAIEDLESS